MRRSFAAFAFASLCAVCGAHVAAQEVFQMPPDSQRCPSKWGPGDQKGAAGEAVTFGNGERRRHDFGRDVGHRRAMHIAHRDGGDEVAVKERGAGEHLGDADA